MAKELYSKKQHLKNLMVGLIFITIIGSFTTNNQVYHNKHLFVDAATVGDKNTSNVLEFGQKADTGNHLYQPQDGSDGNLWDNIGGIVTSTTPFSTTLVDNQSASVGYALFNGALDMSKDVSLSGSFSFQAHSGTDPFAAGDALGFILTPASTADIRVNSANENAIGQNIGIGGLSNSIFVGRDLYQNAGVDTEGTGTANAPSDDISIRQTDASGNLLTSAYACAAAPDNGDSSHTVTNQMMLQWTPASVSVDGSSVTGILTYTISSATAASVTISQSLTVARSLSLGVVGGTGGNYGTLKYDSAGNNLSANKGTQLVQVNYLDQDTNQQIGQSSSILANVGDQVSVISGENANSVESEAGHYDFIAPSVAGYTYQSSSASVIVANNDPENNVINVYYKANPLPVCSATFAFAWTDSNEKDSLPLSITENGVQGDLISAPQIDIPEGYKIDKVVNPKNNVFDNLTDALADSPNYTNNDNLFMIYLSQINQSVPPTKPTEPSLSPSEITKPSSTGQTKQITEISETAKTPQAPQTTKQTVAFENTKVNQTSVKTTTEQVKQPSQSVQIPEPSKVQESTPEKKQSTKVARNIGNYVAESAQALRVRLSGVGGLFVGTSTSVLGFSLLRKLLQFLKK